MTAPKFNFANCSEKELWKHVGAHLSKKGIDAVLVGGAVVSIYSKGAYRSGDLDFVIRTLFVKNIPAIMAQIGFKKTDRYYKHPDCKHLFVEFPPGPLGLGRQFAVHPEESNEGGATLRILSPTDCIKDRLASYIYYKSQDTLDQAVLVAKSQPFKIKEVEKWCLAEGVPDAFKEFKERLSL